MSKKQEERWSIGACQASVAPGDHCVGVAKFTIQQWDEDGMHVVKNETVEIRVRYYPFGHPENDCPFGVWRVVQKLETDGRF